MTEPDRNIEDAGKRIAAARRAVLGEVFRLARDSGAEAVDRPIVSSRNELITTVRDVEPLAGARGARDLELAARHTARDYIRQAREAGYDWDRIGHTLGLAPGADADQAGLTVAEAAYTYAAGRPDTEAPWRPRSFHWHCRSCDQAISDCGPVGTPADDELGHAEDCGRLAAAVAEWDAGWEAEP